MFLITSTDELFKSAAYLTEAFTGVQLPTLSPTPNSPFPADAISSRTNAIPSTSSFVINDPAPCAPTTRSSSALTHIVYPEDEGVHPPSHAVPSTEPLESDFPPKDIPISSQPLAAEPSAPLPRLNLVEASTQTEQGRLNPGDAAQPEKIPAFNLALRTTAPFFDWLENGGEDQLGGTGQGACIRTGSVKHGDMRAASRNAVPGKSFRLERFSRAMIGTTEWEAPKAILSGESLADVPCVIDSMVASLSGFDWYSLPKGSTIVDVGGGIGSTTMTLVRVLSDDSVKKRNGTLNEGLQPSSFAVPRHRPKVPSDPWLMVSDELRNDIATKNYANLRFIVQDRPVVTTLGIEAWRSKCPEMLESGQVVFQGVYFVI